MIVKKVIIPYTEGKPFFHIYPLGDLHEGTNFHADESLQKKVAQIHDDPVGRVVGMGDYGEFITQADKRNDPNGDIYPKWLKQDDIARCIEKQVEKDWEPIKDKTDGLLLGNHENSFRIHNFGDVHGHLCEDMGLDNLGFVCVIHYVFKRENSTEAHLIKGAFTHGTSCAITKNGKKSALLRFMQIVPDCDFYCYAHTHDIDNVEVLELTTTNTLKIKEQVRHGILTGCFFKSYDVSAIPSYGEYKLYPPTRIGCPRIVINAADQTIEPETLEEIRNSN